MPRAGPLNRSRTTRGRGIFPVTTATQTGRTTPNSDSERPRGIDERTLLADRSGRPGPTASSHTPLAISEILEAPEAWLALEADSLDRPVRGQERWEPQPLLETIGSVDDDYEPADQRFTLEAACRKLPVRERLVLHMRFIEDRAQSEIAATIGLSQMQVSRILRGAIERLELAARPELDY